MKKSRITSIQFPQTCINSILQSTYCTFDQTEMSGRDLNSWVRAGRGSLRPPITGYQNTIQSECIQNATFLGPAVTVVSTGNVYQGGLSYGSNRVFKNLVNKNKKKQNKQEDTKNSDIIFKLVKKNINKNSGVKKLD